jgi:hypothetical protein
MARATELWRLVAEHLGRKFVGYSGFIRMGQFSLGIGGQILTEEDQRYMELLHRSIRAIETEVLPIVGEVPLIYSSDPTLGSRPAPWCARVQPAAFLTWLGAEIAPQPPASKHESPRSDLEHHSESDSLAGWDEIIDEVEGLTKKKFLGKDPHRDCKNYLKKFGVKPKRVGAYVHFGRSELFSALASAGQLADGAQPSPRG